MSAPERFLRPMPEAAARARGIEWERIVPLDVFERDGWLCGICGGLTDREAPWDDPEAPEIDHVVLRSMGGPHRLHNVRCAHRRCNGARGLTEAGAVRLVTPAELRDPHRHSEAAEARACARCARPHRNPHPEALYCSGRCRSRAKRERNLARGGAASPVRV